MTAQLAPYAKLITVVSAALVFGSWMVTTLLADRLSNLRQGLTAAKDAHAVMKRLYHLEWKMIELYQVATTTREYVSDSTAPLANAPEHREEFTQIIYMLERTGVSRDILMSTKAYSERLEGYIREIEPDDDLYQELADAIAGIENMVSQFEGRRAVYEAQQEEIVGSKHSINPNTITPAQIASLQDAVRKYRDFTEYELGPEITPTINGLFDKVRDLFDHADTKIKSKAQQQRVAKWTAVGIYIVATILAIFGGYLEAVTAKSVGP